jgi:RNA polymerase sigma-70 factor (ECF subfamily)
MESWQQRMTGRPGSVRRPHGGTVGRSLTSHACRAGPAKRDDAELLPSPTARDDNAEMTTGERLRAFRELAPLLRSLAYRMLGSAADADDILQEVFVRWEGASEEEIRSPRAFLTTITTRLCIDVRRSARARHEIYVGTWLPEPSSESPQATPDASTAFSESLSVAFLVLLESLSPVERAVYLLHAAFELEYSEIAPIVGKSEDNCRQIGRRAIAALGAKKPRFAPSRDERHRLATAFATATRAGSLTGLASMFADDIELWSDGGPAARARFGSTRIASKPIAGKRAVLRFISVALGGAPEGFESHVADINGEPGILGIVGGRIVSAITFVVDDGLIRRVYIVASPHKLSRLSLPS